ncbi:PKD domain-containing protein [Telluribacter sp. SYSU D00476]|uniref:PKD domain-containing protein n=1 Tax=Telluribacter sp. SYSU D00476 TaxID=2811430 RepID=UPI001FF3121A|nr:malectin domain-containing carbohydrate-binding protein [Telluribacter sp. SYSU D00476]
MILLVVLPTTGKAAGIPFPTLVNNGTGQVTVQGELKKWHKITLLIDGPASSETASDNPFLNYRLNVTFSNGSKSYLVPGYFAADGNAAQTSASAGNVWKVHFAPDEVGTWTYSVSMRTGPDLAVSEDPNAGSAVSPVDGQSGSFTIAPTDKGGVDLRGKGRLRYVGQHYLQFAETGEYFLKGGVDSPENFLAYEDFDNTPNNGSRRKTYRPHLQDWQSGDPTWKDGKGKGIIGAINYLSGQGLNAFSFLTMNINGDDRNVYPYLNTSDYTRFDCSKLEQWEKVFEHADTKGMYMNFKFQEKENDRMLDGGDLGTLRKLYYRELIARFGHHLALNWNMGEENQQATQQRKDMAEYFSRNDPYKHHVVIHTYPGEQDEVYTPLLGNSSKYTGAALQVAVGSVYQETKKWVEQSAKAGKKWVVANDEQTPGEKGVAADEDYPGNRGTIADNQNDIRKNALWGNIMALGAGVEYYFGYNTGETDLTAQDFRSRAKMWRYTRHALNFFRTYVPMGEVTLLTNVSKGIMLGKDGHVYVVYLKAGGTANITINTNATYTVKWYNPRTGALQNGSVTSFVGNGSKPLGNPPAESSEDWVVLVQRNSQTTVNKPPTSNAGVDQNITLPASSVTLNGTASDSDGSIASWQWSQQSGPNTAKLSGVNTAQLTASELVAGTYVFRLTVKDNQGASDYDDVAVKVVADQRVVTLTLINADNEQPIRDLADKDVLDLSTLPTRNLNIRANTDPSTVGSVKFVLSGKQRKTQIETGSPYSLFGDKNGNYNAWTPDQGSYVITSTPYTGEDAKGTAGASLTISFDVVGSSSNQSPTVSAGSDKAITLPTNSITLTGSASDHDGSIASYEWSQQSGPNTANLNGANTSSLTASNLVAGTYVFRLTVTDNQGATVFDETVVTVKPAANQAPSADAGEDKTITHPTSSITLTGSASDHDGSIASYEWSQQSGPSQAKLNDASSASLTASELIVGSYVFRLTVTDNQGATAHDEVSVRVNPDPSLAESVASFTLINADTDQPIRELTANDVLNLTTLPTRNLNIRANSDPTRVGSVKFVLNGKETNVRTETDFPYALTGDKDGDYNAWTPSLGDYTLTATPYTGPGATGSSGAALSINFSVIDEPEVNPVVVYRINAGGSSYITSDEKQFIADAHHSSGNTYNAGNADIINTNDDPLYRTERYGNFSYNFPVNNGNYRVILHFAETYLGVKGSGTRKFNVDVEGQRKLSEYDIAAKAGGPLKAIQESFDVNVNDGTLNIDFKKGSENNPKVSALEIVALNYASASRTVEDAGAVVSFTLMNADNEQPIRELTASDVLDLASLPTRNLSIRANTNPDRVGSVKMVLSGQQSRTQIETGFPYSLFGDEGGNYNAWTPAVGDYRLTGTPYTERGATGTAGTPLSISFKITNTSAARISFESLSEPEGLQVKYYPNPFAETITLQVQGKGSGKLPAILFDVNGRVVMQLEDLQAEQTITLGKEVAPGMYILHIGAGRKLKTYKLIKAE